VNAVTAQLARDGFSAKRRRVMVTPEGIALPITVATRAARIGALLIDLTLIVVLIVVATLMMFWLAIGTLPPPEQLAKSKDPALQALMFLYIAWIIAVFLFRNAWFLFFELGPRGATPGKRIAGIRVAARDGGRLSAEMIIARNLLRDIELFMPLLLLVSGGNDMGVTGLAALAWFLLLTLFPLFNKDNLRAGDLIAGTWVVEAPREKLAAAMSTTQAAQGAASATTGAAYRFGEAELAVYGEYELQTLERVLREDRSEALVAVHEAICRKIGWDPGAGDERAFLEAYYTQLRGGLESGMRMGKRKADKWAQ
jgi:uncharacterized RDD family membrane protein YckC